MWKWALALGVLWLVHGLLGDADPLIHPPGVLAPAPPHQEPIGGASIAHEGYAIRPLARFTLTARVLGTENYRWDREADLSPMDFALGWGPMSDQAVLDQIQIWQSGRWYRWQVDTFPIPRQVIETHSANMHFIPANQAVGRVMERAREGDVISVSGQLVEVVADDGWTWQSSLTRDDTGANACELVWVEAMQIITPPT